MSVRRIVLAVAMLGIAARADAQVLTKEQQIAVALKAAPEDMRSGATVLGYGAAGKFVTLQQGTNDMICTPDDPADEGFEVSCYHESIQPYIARGRELRAQGVQGAVVNETRWQEMAAKKLGLPETGATQYILTGTFDAASGELTGTYLRWVIYTPFATPQSTGLAAKGGVSVPWLMYPGKAGSHIMILPPRPAPAGG
jgi:hypothetical protein